MLINSGMRSAKTIRWSPQGRGCMFSSLLSDTCMCPPQAPPLPQHISTYLMHTCFPPFLLCAGGRHQPFYHVLVDPSDRGGQQTYVAEDNILLEPLPPHERFPGEWREENILLQPPAPLEALTRWMGRLCARMGGLRSRQVARVRALCSHRRMLCFVFCLKRSQVQQCMFPPCTPQRLGPPAVPTTSRPTPGPSTTTHTPLPRGSPPQTPRCVAHAVAPPPAGFQLHPECGRYFEGLREDGTGYVMNAWMRERYPDDEKKKKKRG